jgi:imidazoleglycerol phosphate synthase glutamine amidotransferase subunit HisH
MQNIRTIKATPNHSQRTFTLRVYHNGKLTFKYRTIKLPKDEFNSCIYNTNGDWLQFLKSDEYYLVHSYK